jgi:hypothetical protein
VATTETSLARRLDKLVEKQAKLEEARKSAGIPKLESEIDLLKQEITADMVESGTATLLSTRGSKATLVQASYDARFIGTTEDIRGDEGRKVVPLHTIIYKKFDKIEAGKVWRQITKRVVVPEKVEEAVAEGFLTVNEISVAFVEKTKKPYIRITK